MALDQALLDQADAEGLACLRLYRWNPFCLSFGRHEPAARRYGRERIAQGRLDVVRRPTGGRAVWHARELTYAVAAPLGGESLAGVYLRLHATMLAAVRALGAAEADLAQPPPRIPRPGDGACFDVAVGGEVVVRGRKVLGSAQVRQGTAFLQHGSLLLEDGQQVVRDLLDTSGDTAPEAPLAAVLGRPVTFAEAADAVIAAFGAESWSAPDLHGIQPAAAIHGPRFRSEAWTWER